MSCTIERGKPVVCRDTRHAQGHGLVVCNSSNTRQLGCVFQDQNPSLRLICPGEPHQRSPNAPKLEDRSQEESSPPSPSFLHTHTHTHPSAALVSSHTHPPPPSFLHTHTLRRPRFFTHTPSAALVSSHTPFLHLLVSSDTQLVRPSLFLHTHNPSVLPCFFTQTQPVPPCFFTHNPSLHVSSHTIPFTWQHYLGPPNGKCRRF